ncbi:MAG: ADP-ribosylglycohydrolase family protein [Planctomyces sp.]|nr:ADP-ribosylglycohydrolase family protein [Planctomyces sp.]
MSDVLDRVKGVLVGLAAGDSNGGPIRMAVRLGESLLENRGFDRTDVMERYMEWYRDGAFDTGVVADLVFSRVAVGQSFEFAARAVHMDLDNRTGGCNPAHRNAPLAMCFQIDDADLAKNALLEAALTHFDPIAGDVSAAVVTLCRQLIKGVTWHEAIDISADGRSVHTKAAFRRTTMDDLDRGGYAPDVLTAAIHFLEHAGTFSEALNASMEFAGLSNFCPVLVGSIGGARWGAKAVSHERSQDGDLHSFVEVVSAGLGAEWEMAGGASVE